MPKTDPKAVLYNEIDPFAVQWLTALARHEVIHAGKIETTPIEQIDPSTLAGVRRFHAFAGIGAWDYALALAGWPRDASVWTGSCPCQPFSGAGRRKGVGDARHLWPAWFTLIREHRPATIFGEQVASPDGRVWLDAVSADLETLGYAVGSSDLCAAGVGAPHIRQRLYWVAISDSQRRDRVDSLLRTPQGGRRGASSAISQIAGRGATCGVGDSDGARSQVRTGPEERYGAVRLEGAPFVTPGPWADAEWWLCQDGRARPAQPGAFPLADGAPARVGRLRAYGNAIVPQVAATFVRAVIDAQD